jgi:hypothetical protein
MKASPREVLEKGAKLMEPFLRGKGFSFNLLREGKGSGGFFVTGEFHNADRRLELHFRDSLGLVRYHLGKSNASHESYMKELGVAAQCRYPGFSDNPLDAFTDLLHDLQSFGNDFLCGEGDVLICAAQHEREATSARDIKESGRFAGDTRMRAEARELFRQKRYAEVVQLLERVRFPEILTEPDRKMLEIAKKAR